MLVLELYTPRLVFTLSVGLASSFTWPLQEFDRRKCFLAHKFSMLVLKLFSTKKVQTLWFKNFINKTSAYVISIQCSWIRFASLVWTKLLLRVIFYPLSLWRCLPCDVIILICSLSLSWILDARFSQKFYFFMIMTSYN